MPTQQDLLGEVDQSAREMRPGSEAVKQFFGFLIAAALAPGDHSEYYYFSLNIF